MTRLFAAAGVDYAQWRAVSRTLLRSDFRAPLTDETWSLGRLGGLLAMAAFFGLFGVGAAFFVVASDDVLLTGTLSLAYLSVMLATTLLSQHGATMLATADYAILAPRPVSSRTFLAIRLTNVLFHAMLITTLMAYPVVLAYTLAHGPSVWRGAAAVASIYSWALVVTMAVVVSYAALLRVTGAARLLRAVGYLQVVSGLLVYSGMLLVSSMLRTPLFQQASAPDAWWFLLLPPAWFASVLELAAGAGNSTTWARMTLSCASIVIPIAVLRARLGVEYAAYLGELQAAGEEPAAHASRTPGFARGTGRAVALLVLAHFRHDLRVRTRVLAIVPLIVLYFVIDRSDTGLDLVAMAVLLFPALLTQNFSSSDAHRAAWIYHVTRTPHDHILLALKNVAVVYFLAPFLLFMLLVFTWRAGDLAHAVVHTAMLGAVSHIALQASLAMSPRLPFSLPVEKTRTDLSLFVWLVFVLIGGQVLLAALERWVYVDGWRTAAAFSALVALSLLAGRLLTRRARAIPS